MSVMLLSLMLLSGSSGRRQSAPVDLGGGCFLSHRRCGAQARYFSREGLDVELIRMNANVSITALSTGDIDYTMVFSSVVRGALRGMPMKVVASYMDSSTHLLIARPEYKAIQAI